MAFKLFGFVLDLWSSESNHRKLKYVMPFESSRMTSYSTSTDSPSCTVSTKCCKSRCRLYKRQRSKNLFNTKQSLIESLLHFIQSDYHFNHGCSITTNSISSIFDPITYPIISSRYNSTTYFPSYQFDTIRLYTVDSCFIFVAHARPHVGLGPTTIS